jgi:hypothetical protein
MLFSFDNTEPAVVGNLPLLVFRAIDIVDGNWSGKFFASYPKLFPGVFINEVISSAAIYESGFVGLGLRGAKRTFIFRVDSFLMYIVSCNPVALSQTIGFELPRNPPWPIAPRRGSLGLQ